MRRFCIPGIVLLFCSGFGLADEPTSGAASPRIEEPAMDVVLVSGEQPGPALWKASSGNHDLWILGEVTPLPRKVKWRSKQFESLLSNSQEVILHNSASYSHGRQAAELARATKLPDEQKLTDLVSPELLARVETVAKIYGVDEPLETLSPPVVAGRFANASLKTLNLRVMSLQVSVEALARKAKVRITNYSTPQLDVPFEERLQTVKDNAMAVCALESVVQVLADGGSGLRSLANAWAVGDIDALRRLLPEYGLFTDGNRSSLCLSGVYDGRKQTGENRDKRNAPWLAEAERALRENESTLAVVPMPELFATDGYLAGLRARGYDVIEPD
jgi:hypothetical protein